MSENSGKRKTYIGRCQTVSARGHGAPIRHAHLLADGPCRPCFLGVGALRAVLHAHSDPIAYRLAHVFLDLVARIGAGAGTAAGGRRTAAPMADLVAENAAYYRAARRPEPSALTLDLDRAYGLDYPAI